MLQSKLFTKTRRENPKNEVSKNANILIRAGFVNKEMAGVYSFLPLGILVIEKIKNIVREEMNIIGGQEILMSSLQRKDIWEKTNRWDDKVVDIWFKSNLHVGGEVGFGWSHEEPIVEMMKNHIISFRDLPVYVYQFQTKLRNELRAKSGMMRGREFLMKDMYSFSLNEKEHSAFYASAIDAYEKIFKRLGIGDDTFMTLSTGGAFTEYSHEFQTIVRGGEDIIYINREKNISINEEILNNESLKNLKIKRNELKKVKTSEVGNIFNFGTTKCIELGLMYNNEKDEQTPVWLGSYGIGISRLVGVLAEKFSDDDGLIWPESVTPFKFHILALGEGKIKSTAKALYDELTEAGIEVLFDDRATSAGSKFFDADLIGIPYRVVISEKAISSGKIELKKRSEEKSKLITKDTLFDI